MMKRALGRGLGALLPPTGDPPPVAEPGGAPLLALPVEQLTPNPYQPR